MIATCKSEEAEPKRLTISVGEAARRLGVGKLAAYDAVHRGEIPVLRIGRKMLVPLVAFEQMLAVQCKQQLLAAELVRRLQQKDGDAAE
jgi:excisionase family DNA binding protein